MGINLLEPITHSLLKMTGLISRLMRFLWFGKQCTLAGYIANLRFNFNLVGGWNSSIHSHYDHRSCCTNHISCCTLFISCCTLDPGNKLLHHGYKLLHHGYKLLHHGYKLLHIGYKLLDLAYCHLCIYRQCTLKTFKTYRTLTSFKGLKLL